jgi:hypothetical protein
MRKNERYEKIGAAKKKQIARHEQTERQKGPGIPADVRVEHSAENNPHDG